MKTKNDLKSNSRKYTIIETKTTTAAAATTSQAKKCRLKVFLKIYPLSQAKQLWARRAGRAGRQTNKAAFVNLSQAVGRTKRTTTTCCCPEQNKRDHSSSSNQKKHSCLSRKALSVKFLLELKIEKKK